jgi:hypothetical protein
MWPEPESGANRIVTTPRLPKAFSTPPSPNSRVIVNSLSSWTPTTAIRLCFTDRCRRREASHIAEHRPAGVTEVPVEIAGGSRVSERGGDQNGNHGGGRSDRHQALAWFPPH